MDIQVRESEIEDVLAIYPDLLKKWLSFSDDIFLVARQKPVNSGRLDLVYSYHSDLILVELKVEIFRKAFVNQVLSYQADLINLQKQKKFVNGTILPYLLCPAISKENLKYSQERGVNSISYDPAKVLDEFFQRAPLGTRYFSVLPTDKGVWRIGLINESLYLLANENSRKNIANTKNLSVKTIGNQLRLAEELGLIIVEGKSYLLSSFGEHFVKARDLMGSIDYLSKEQLEVIRKFILSNPFYSGVTFGILTMAACIFDLSKNTYPVPISLLSKHFINAAGLHYRWNKDKAVDKGVRMYSNYAIELGLVGKIGNGYYVTPSGLNFILLLNMHKSLKFIEAVNFIK
jgi:hypothetical protein